MFRQNRKLCDVPPDVAKSLEILDNILDEFEDGKETVKDVATSVESVHTDIRHEDIRRSLEVLDSVLAEYDDAWNSSYSYTNGIDTYSFPTSDSQGAFEERETDMTHGNRHSTSELRFSSINSSIDGSTSQLLRLVNQDQPKVTSPPPVPKRSPATRLSDRSVTLFAFPPDTASLDSSDDSILSDALSSSVVLSSSQPLHLSSPITRLSQSEITAQPQDEVFESLQQQQQHSSLPLDCERHCLVCGRGLTAVRNVVSTMNGGVDETSPFLERRRMLDAHFSFRTSPASPRKFDESESTRNLGSGDISSSPKRFGSYVTPPISRKSPKKSSVSRCSACERKIRELDAKFAQTRNLLRTNVIKVLQNDPPSFKPPSPPPSMTSEDSSMCNGRLHDSTRSEPDEDCRYNSRKNRQGLICDDCSKSVVTETIEDLPNLIPTDALNRPQLGLSYSLEDDLCPGVKEIQTSTPKSDASLRFSPKMVAKESTGLSTFSQSVNSLGYVSSQSDLELNFSAASNDSREKVPVASLKSQTLPIGIKLTPSPFYSTADHSYDNGHSVDSKLTGNLLGLETRSNSAPPLPPKEEKKKHTRAFSRREKKDNKKKNEDNISVKSDLSFDEGIILKRIDALDGSTDIADYIDKNERSDEKPKKRGIWKSILRKK